MQGKSRMSEAVEIYMLCSEFHCLPSDLKKENTDDIMELKNVLQMKRYLENKEANKSKRK